jgi:hypothetical protein
MPCHQLLALAEGTNVTKREERRITQNGLSFLRIVDEGTIHCKRGAPLLIVYSSTARRLFNTVDATCKLATYESPVIRPHVSGTGPTACKIESAQQQLKQLA